MQFLRQDFLPEPADTLTARHGLRTNSRKRPCQTDQSLFTLDSQTDPIYEPSNSQQKIIIPFIIK